jgi:hypothetical protein
MNINKATFNGVRIKVTYKCGHVQTELSKSDSESRTRKLCAMAVVCTACSISRCKKATALRPTVDPSSMMHYQARKEGISKLTERFSTLRTH